MNKRRRRIGKQESTQCCQSRNMYNTGSYRSNHYIVVAYKINDTSISFLYAYAQSIVQLRLHWYSFDPRSVVQPANISISTCTAGYIPEIVRSTFLAPPPAVLAFGILSVLTHAHLDLALREAPPKRKVSVLLFHDTRSWYHRNYYSENGGQRHR